MKRTLIKGALVAAIALCASQCFAQCFGGRCYQTTTRRASVASYRYAARVAYSAPVRACEPVGAVVEPCAPIQACAPVETCEPVDAPEPCAPVETCEPSQIVDDCGGVLVETNNNVRSCPTGACPIRAVAQTAVKTATAPVRVVASLLDAANRTRARYGLPALKYDAALEAGADFQAQYCSEVGSLQHGYGVAEILAQNNQGIEEAVNQWLASPGHRALLLNGGYKFAGVGVVRDKHGRYWCAMRFR